MKSFLLLSFKIVFAVALLLPATFAIAENENKQETYPEIYVCNRNIEMHGSSGGDKSTESTNSSIAFTGRNGLNTDSFIPQHCFICLAWKESGNSTHTILKYEDSIGFGTPDAPWKIIIGKDGSTNIESHLAAPSLACILAIGRDDISEDYLQRPGNGSVRKAMYHKMAEVKVNMHNEEDGGYSVFKHNCCWVVCRILQILGVNQTIIDEVSKLNYGTAAVSQTKDDNL
jgi:hypothetical protein